MQRIEEYDEIGQIIGKYAFRPGNHATAEDFARRKRGIKSPYLECVKELCSISGHNEIARGMIRIYCDMRKIDNIDLFRAHYVDSVSIAAIAKKELLHGDADNVRRTLYKQIDNVQRDFAVWLSNAIPLWLCGCTPVMPEHLPCRGNKSVMRGNCKRCFFNDVCV